MKNKKILYIILPIILLYPLVSFAALNGVMGLLNAIKVLLRSLIPIIFGISLIYFFWGIAQFILHDAGNEKTREDGKKKIMWGVLALFVFISIYGIIKFIGDTLGIETNIRSSASSGTGGVAGTGGGPELPEDCSNLADQAGRC